METWRSNFVSSSFFPQCSVQDAGSCPACSDVSSQSEFPSSFVMCPFYSIMIMHPSMPCFPCSFSKPNLMQMRFCMSSAQLIGFTFLPDSACCIPVSRYSLGTRSGFLRTFSHGMNRPITSSKCPLYSSSRINLVIFPTASAPDPST